MTMDGNIVIYLRIFRMMLVPLIVFQQRMKHFTWELKMDAPAEIRGWLGDSIGHWEGDTLVIDTTNFNDTPALRQATRDLHVVERFSRLDADTLLYQFTVEDPNVWSAPWSGEYAWPASDNRVYEYACHEANYSFQGILGGARILEQDVRDGKVTESR